MNITFSSLKLLDEVQLNKRIFINQVGDIIDQMFAMLDKIQDFNTSKVTCIKYTVEVILHKDNNKSILSNLSSILSVHIQLLADKKGIDQLTLPGEQTNNVLSLFIDFITHAIEYNESPTIQNFITILRTLEAEYNIIRRYELIYSLSKNVSLPQLNLYKSQEEV